MVSDYLVLLELMLTVTGFFLPQSYNKEHVKLLNDMGITVAMLSDGRMQLVHNYVAVSNLIVLFYYVMMKGQGYRKDFGIFKILYALFDSQGKQSNQTV